MSIYRNVLTFGRSVLAAGPHGIAEIGGVWQTPRFSLSYLLGARRLIDGARDAKEIDEIALPVAYLQRHAFELALKDLIELAYEIKTNSEWIARLAKDPRAEPPTPDAVRREHRLPIIIADLRNALHEIGWGDVPDELVEMSERLTGIEREEPTRLRYNRIKPRRRAEESSFPEVVTLALGKTQEILEKLFEEHLVVRDNSLTMERNNLIESLALEQMGQDQRLYSLAPWWFE
jgi:hypothetical protein